MKLYIVENGEAHEDDGGYFGVLGLDWIPVLAASEDDALEMGRSYDCLSREDAKPVLARAITEAAKIGGQAFIDALIEARPMREVNDRLPRDFVWPHLPTREW